MSSALNAHRKLCSLTPWRIYQFERSTVVILLNTKHCCPSSALPRYLLDVLQGLWHLVPRDLFSISGITILYVLLLIVPIKFIEETSHKNENKG